VPIQFRKQKNITYGIYLLKINNGNTGNFLRHKQQGFGIFDVEGFFPELCQGCFWEAQMFQDGYHRPEKGTEKEEMMASHEDRKQKNARYRLAWLVGGFGPIENWQILAEFSTK